MKRNILFLIFLIIFFDTLAGCSRGNRIHEAIGSNNFVLDKVVFEKNREDCNEIVVVYFKGDDITKVEAREIYWNKDSLSKAYKYYCESPDYVNLRTSDLAIGYEYSSSHVYNFFDGIRGKDNILGVLQNERGYIIK